MKILFTGGGTGGHIVPLIAVIRELRKIHGGAHLQLFYMGPRDNFNELLFSQEGIRISNVMAGKVRRYFGPLAILQNIIDIFFRMPIGFIQAFFKLLFIRPDAIFSKGGYGALPATIAGWLLWIPIFLHESDQVPGKANKIAATFARKVFIAFPHTPFSPSKTLLTGNPVRREILDGSKQEAMQIFRLKGDKPVLLIIGGSQGAQKINDVVLAILNDMLTSFEVIHQTGEKNFQEVSSEAKTFISQENTPYYHPAPFLKEPELRHAYAACDFIIARAGSGTIFETAALGKPSILIPLLGAAQNHQVQNAYAYQKTGACIVLEESNLTPHFFLEKLKATLGNQKELDAMSQAALSFAKPEAAKTIAQYLLEYLDS